MTRNGKIARLPQVLREQLNRRLQDGEPVKTIVPWLNERIEVKALMQVYYNGRPIRAQNISEWRKGGFREWQAQQDALEQIPLVAREGGEMRGQVKGALTDHLADWLAGHLMAVVRRLAATDLTDAARWKLLHEACADLVALRRGDQNAEWMEIERERLLYQRNDLMTRFKKRVIMGMETLGVYVKKHPQAKAAWDALLAQVTSPLDNPDGSPELGINPENVGVQEPSDTVAGAP